MSAPLSREMTHRFMHILNWLSPENLHADGERTPTAAKVFEKQLRAQWRALERELGRAVSEDEVWAAFLDMPRQTRVSETSRSV